MALKAHDQAPITIPRIRKIPQKHKPKKGVLLDLKIEALEAERVQLIAAGTLPGWIEPYTATRKNKALKSKKSNGKPRAPKQAERTYTYYHHCWSQSGSVIRKHLSKQQLSETNAAIERRRRVEQIDTELKVLRGEIQC